MPKPNKTADPDPLLTSAQVAQILGVTASTVSRWVRYNRIKTIKVGRWNRFTPQEVILLIRQNHPTSEVKTRISKMQEILDDTAKDRIVARTKA